MKNKKSQMEIIGLAIVIILLILGFVFVVKFVMNNEPTNYRERFIPSQLASNTLNAFLNSNSPDCSNMAIRELLRDCAQGETILCTNGLGSCDYVGNVAQTIFLNTLDVWNYDYHYLVFLLNNENSPIHELGLPCPRERQRKQFFIPTSLGVLTARIDICS